MKSTLFAAAFFVIGTAQAAGNWQPIMDAKSGGRLIVDVDTVDFSIYDKNGKKALRATATMQMLADGEIHEPFSAIIDVDECIKNQRGVLLNVYQDGTVDKYFWHANGNKMYDAQAQWLCAVTIEADRDNKNKSGKKFL